MTVLGRGWFAAEQLLDSQLLGIPKKAICASLYIRALRELVQLNYKAKAFLLSVFYPWELSQWKQYKQLIVGN